MKRGRSPLRCLSSGGLSWWPTRWRGRSRSERAWAALLPSSAGGPACAVPPVAGAARAGRGSPRRAGVRSRDVVGQRGKRARRVRGVADAVDLARREALGEQAQQLACQPGFRGPLGVGLVFGHLLAPRAPEPEEHQQADGPLRNGSLTLIPAVTQLLPQATAPVRWRLRRDARSSRTPSVLDAWPTCRRSGQQAVDRARADATRSPRPPKPQLIGRPASVTEEPVRTSVMPDPGQPRADQHPRHAPQLGLGDLAPTSAQNVRNVGREKHVANRSRAYQRRRTIVSADLHGQPRTGLHPTRKWS